MFWTQSMRKIMLNKRNVAVSAQNVLWQYLWTGWQSFEPIIHDAYNRFSSFFMQLVFFPCIKDNFFHLPPGCYILCWQCTLACRRGNICFNISLSRLIFPQAFIFLRAWGAYPVCFQGQQLRLGQVSRRGVPHKCAFYTPTCSPKNLPILLSLAFRFFKTRFLALLSMWLMKLMKFAKMKWNRNFNLHCPNAIGTVSYSQHGESHIVPACCICVTGKESAC